MVFICVYVANGDTGLKTEQFRSCSHVLLTFQEIWVSLSFSFISLQYFCLHNTENKQLLLATLMLNIPCVCIYISLELPSACVNIDGVSLVCERIDKHDTLLWIHCGPKSL